MDRRAATSLARLAPRLDARFAADADPVAWAEFGTRLERHFGALFEALVTLYGGQWDFFYHLEQILEMAARMWLARPIERRALDAAREADPAWFQDARMLGGVCYVDRFAGDLAGLRARLPYLEELGLTYLHLMPLFLAPAGNNDGGYAVSDYRQVAPALGTMAELSALGDDLRRRGMVLVLDFVFNHTSDEHPWARRALAGDPDYQDYYLTFPDRALPDAYERTLREIFPEERPGNFTWRPEIGRWVWTTFNSFQLDLNYANPVVFARMAEELLFLANAGADVLRLDAIVFAWKRLGTSCENLPETHTLVRAFNAVARIAAPGLLFKSEAIVHPDDVLGFVSPRECQLSYNPLLMATGWEALATRGARLLRASTAARLRVHPGCAWVNYVRSHDDIGWTFDDGDAARLGIDASDHRRFLNAFYTGRFPGSFARGLPFQENPRTGDARVCGTAASLAGLEGAMRDGDEPAIALAIRRILLLYGIALTVGGIPLLYLGDELGTLNDYGYRADPARAGDSRWVHRPAFDPARAAARRDPATVPGRVYAGLRRLIAMRQGHPAFGGPVTEVLDMGDEHVFAYARHRDDARIVVLANMDERERAIAANELRLRGLAYAFTDLVSGDPVAADRDLVLAPYALACLAPREERP